MRPKSAQAKGDRFENYLVTVLRQEIDVKTHRTTGSGNGYDKNDIRVPSLNLEIEAKNAAKYNIVSDWEQTKTQRTTGNMAVLAIRNPRLPEFQETLVVLDLNDFLTLLQERGGAREVSYTADQNMKYDILRLVEAGKKVIKHFN